MRGPALYLLCGLVGVYLTPASGQLFGNVSKFFQNMTFDWDVRHRGGLNLPYCIKRLMNCWEVIKADLVCVADGEWYYESACMLMHNRRCHDLRPYGLDNYYPYVGFRFYVGLCKHSTTWWS